MELETNAELLGRVPIFAGLSREQLIAIAGLGREVHFEQGKMVLGAGQTGHAAYLVLNGSVALKYEDDSTFAPEVLGFGTFLGELAMLVETTFTVSVITRWPVRALAIERKAMLAVMDEDPTIAWHFSGKLLERLQQLALDLKRVDGRFAMIEVSLEHAIEQAAGELLEAERNFG